MISKLTQKIKKDGYTLAELLLQAEPWGVMLATTVPVNSAESKGNSPRPLP